MAWTLEKKKKQVVDQVNHIALLLDASGSMASINSSAITAFNSKIDTVVDTALQQKNSTTTLTVVLFNDNATYLHKAAVIADPGKKGKAALKKRLHLTNTNYRISGSTAMRDAMVDVLDWFESRPDAHLPNVSFLMEVITDGAENQSRNSIETLQTKLTSAKATDRFTLGLLVPADPYNSYKKLAISTMGLDPGEIQEWETTAEGVREATVMSNTSLTSYYATRSAGGTKMIGGLYSSTAPTKSVLNKQSDDITSECKQATVAKENNVSDWYNATFKGIYRKGICFYQLTKRELIQEYKEVLIQDKTTKKIYHADSRNILGIPETGNVKVEPGNHGNYDIFVQSTSSNRKLVRGSKVIVWPNAPVKAALGVV